MRKTMLARRKEEDGWVLVTAISLMTIMLIIGLASMSIVDTQQKRSREQRERESSLNLVEGALYAQGFQLAGTWPGTATVAATMQDCSSAATATGCPTATQVQQNAANIDTAADTTWTTLVRDNGGPNMNVAFQSDYMNSVQSGTNALGQSYTCGSAGPPAVPCRWDANGDRKVWVQASGVVRGKTRTVVATLKLERIAESTPRAAVVAGGINTGNKGSQIKIWGDGSSVVVRCDPTKSQCVSDQGGIYPDAAQGNPANLMTPSQLQRFKSAAVANGTYYDGCPATKDFRGAVVWVENCNLSASASTFAASACSPALPPKPGGGGNGLQPDCINQIGAPGLLIWHCGTMDLSGKATYIGIMYFVNNSDGTCPAGVSTPRGISPPDCSAKNHGPYNVMTTSGGFGVYGALAIDGNACLTASANGMQVQYDANVFKAAASYGTVGLVQDTWRELTPR